MSNITTIGNIRKLITQGRTKLAAEHLVTLTQPLDRDLFESALLLNSRVEFLEQQVIEGVLSVADQNIEQAKLTKSLLALASNVEEQCPQVAIIEEKQTEITDETTEIPVQKDRNRLKLIGIATIVVSIAAIVFWFLTKKTKKSVVVESEKPKVEVVEQKHNFEGDVRFPNGQAAPLSIVDFNYQNTSFKDTTDVKGHYKVELPLATIGKTVNLTIKYKGHAVISQNIVVNEAILKSLTIPAE